MLFNSYEFLIFFLPVVLAGYYFIARPLEAHYRGTTKIFLTLVSLFFYGAWKREGLFLILTSIVLNFYLAEQIAVLPNPRWKRGLLTAGIGLNLLVLAYYKYLTFFFEGLARIHLIDFSAVPASTSIPLAISFFTFQQIAFLVESYRKSQRFGGILDYATSVLFFPHLIAGPLVHYSSLRNQFNRFMKAGSHGRNLAIGLAFLP